MIEMRGVVVGEDGVARCPWAHEPPVMRAYHDTEWGVTVRGERGLFERLTLEAFQSGLSWLTILNKRPAFREVFADFDADTVARFTDGDVEHLMQDARIVRNRAKIEATRTNARAIVELRQDGGLDALVWSYQPVPRPAATTLTALPAKTPESVALSKELRRRGFAFVGPTTIYSLMEAVSMVDDHLEDCHRRGVAVGQGRPVAAFR